MRAGNIYPQKAGKGKDLTLLVTVVLRTFGGYREWWPLLQPIVWWANLVCNQLETDLMEWRSSLTISPLLWAIADGIHINIEKKKLREEYWSERGPKEVYSEFSFLGRLQKKFLEKNQDACLDILVNLNYYKEKAENPKAGEAQDLSFVFFGNLESQWCLTFVREGLGTGETTITWREFGSVHGECTAGRRGSDESGTKQGQFLRGALNTRQGDKLIWKQFANCWLEV